jgi:hypothetical protein
MSQTSPPTADKLPACQPMAELLYPALHAHFTLVGDPGLEPGTSTLSVSRSNQLS